MVVNPFVFGGGGGATTAPFVVIPFDTGTATTSLALTDSGYFGGDTPSGLITFGSMQSVASGASETAHGQLQVGVASASATGYTATVSENGVANTNLTRTLNGTYAYGIIASSTNSHLKRFVRTLGANGVTFDRSAGNSGGDLRAMAALFDAATTAAVGSLNLGTGTSAITVTPGFQADAVIFIGDCGANNVFGNFSSISFGIATSAAQRVVTFIEADSSAAGSMNAAMLSTATIAQVDATTGALSYSCAVGNFTATSFDVTPSASAGSDEVKWIALKFDARSVKLLDWTTPTSTGSQAITGAGFAPSAFIGALSNLQAIDPSFPVSGSAQTSALSLVISDGTTTHSSAMRAEFGAATTNTASNAQNKILQPSATATDAGQATLTSMDSDGITLNWSAVQGNAKKGFLLFIE